MSRAKVSVAVAVLGFIAFMAIAVMILNTISPVEKRRIVQATTVPVASAAWQTVFDAIYKLKPNENAKFIPPPFIPERLDYYRAKSPGQADAIPRGPDSMILTQRGEEMPGNPGMMFGGADVSWALSCALNLSWSDLETTQDFMRTDLPGDWVVRAGATREQKMPAVADAIGKAIGETVEFKPKTAEREAIVVRGKYAFKPTWPATHPAYERNSVHLFRGEPDLSEEGSGGGTADLKGLLEHLGRQVRMPIIIENVPPVRQVSWRNHRSAQSEDNDPLRPDEIDEVLANVAKQTSLELKREKRTMPIWQIVVTPKPNADK